MKYSYDFEADALYIEIVEDGAIDRQIEFEDGVIVDVAPDGTAVGIDVMAPNAGWQWRPIVARFDLRTEDAEMLSHLARATSWCRSPSGDMHQGNDAAQAIREEHSTPYRGGLGVLVA